MGERQPRDRQVAQLPAQDQGLRQSLRWQTLQPSERLSLISSVLNDINTASSLLAQRRLGGRAGTCETFSLGLQKRFAAPEVNLQFVRYDSGQLEETFDLPWGELSGNLGHTFGILEGALLFDLAIENGYQEGDQVPPIVEQLMKEGYVALTDENLHAYAEALAKKTLPDAKIAGCKERFLEENQ